MCLSLSSRPGKPNIIHLISRPDRGDKYHMEQNGLSPHDLIPFIAVAIASTRCSRVRAR